MRARRSGGRATVEGAGVVAVFAAAILAILAQVAIYGVIGWAIYKLVVHFIG